MANSKKYKSFFLELITIRAFEDNQGSIPSGLWPKLEMVMEFIRDNVETIQLKDPANSSNIVSDTLTPDKKAALASEMKFMLRQIEEDDESIKVHFPVNEVYDGKKSASGPSILPTRSFG